MGLKEMMLRRIEKDAIKITIEGKIIYIKKGGFFKEWRVIYPPVNPETKKWDKINLYFGGKGNAFRVFLIGVIAVIFALGVYDIVSSYNNIFSNPAVQACLKASGINIGG